MFFFRFCFFCFFGFGLSSLIAVCCFGFANEIKQPKRSGQFWPQENAKKGRCMGGGGGGPTIYIYIYMHILSMLYMSVCIYIYTHQNPILILRPL